MPNLGRASSARLRQQVTAIEAGADEDGVLPDPAGSVANDRYTMQAEPFGAWLLAQTATSRWYAPIVKAAKADHKFPKRGDPEAVRKHMHVGGADPETFEMIDDAELDWSSL